MKRLNEQLRRAARFTGRNQFVAGREHRDADAPDDVELRQAKGRDQRDILRPQPPAGLQCGVACGNVLARGPHIGARLQPGGKHNLAVFEADVLLHEHGIGAVRHRRAGKDAHRLPWFDRGRRGAAGLNAPGDRECLLVLAW